MIITIDGLSTNGKTTLAKKISKEIGFKSFNTGAVYRCIALTILNNKLDINNIELIIKCLEDIDIDFDNDKILLNHQDVTQQLYTEEINYYSTEWANILEIKNFVRQFQQQYLKKYNTVMEGRNIGAVIAPYADIKFYLYSDFEVRVYRKWKLNKNVKIEDIRREVMVVDDLEIKNQLFVKPEDAYEINTNDKTVEKVYKIMMSEIYRKIN